MAHHTIALLPGDGIGHEVVAATRRVLEALERSSPDLSLSIHEAMIGVTAFEATGDPLPQETLDLARSADAVLHGATDGASLPKGLPKPLRGLRDALGVYANLRPATSYPAVPSLRDDVDVVVVRELSEGLHVHAEHAVGDGAVCSTRITTRTGTERVAVSSFEVAQRRRGRLTVVHKRGALPLGDGLWIEVIEEVATRYPDVELDLRNVDAAAHELILRPADFDVILAENSRGDILSDVAAALSGGLGLTASGSFGDRWAYFEPVHGTAPDIAGRGVANPSACVLAAALMLDHLGEVDAAERIRGAVALMLDDPEARTRDLGGSAGTQACTQAILDALEPAPSP